MEISESHDSESEFLANLNLKLKPNQRLRPTPKSVPLLGPLIAQVSESPFKFTPPNMVAPPPPLIMIRVCGICRDGSEGPPSKSL